MPADGVQTVGFGERKLARTFPCTLLEVADVQWFAGRAREHERIGRAPREGREMCAKDGCFVGGQVGAPAAKVAIGPLCFRSSALAAFTGVGPRPPGDARVPRTESLGFVLASKRDRVEVGERRRRHCRCPGPNVLAIARSTGAAVLRPLPDAPRHVAARYTSNPAHIVISRAVTAPAVGVVRSTGRPSSSSTHVLPVSPTAFKRRMNSSRRRLGRNVGDTRAGRRTEVAPANELRSDQRSDPVGPS